MKSCMLFFLLGLFPPNIQNGNTFISDETIKVNFNSKVDFNELVKIKLDLAEKGISINYKRIVFNDYNEQKEISFDVNCNDGFKGSAANAEITNNSKFGFIRDYQGGIPFVAGNISDY